MKIRVSVFFTIVFLTIQSSYGMSLGEWSYGTKHRTFISGDGGVQIENRRNRIYNVKKWYYYKDHIIGLTSISYHKTEEQKESYFILNELTGKIDTFQNAKEWRDSIRESELKPIYTRWYTNHFNRALFLIALCSIIYPFFSIPIFLLLLYLLFKFLKEVFFRERFNLKEPFTQVFIFLSLIISICLFLSNNYQSF